MSDMCVSERGLAVLGPGGLPRPWSTWQRIVPESGLLVVLLAVYAASWMLLGLFTLLPVPRKDSFERDVGRS